MPHYEINYIELPATDFAAMKDFYGSAFGWEFEDWGDDYVAFSNAGLEGGFRPVDEPAPQGGATIILIADDLAEAERSVTAAGGTVTARHEFPGGARFHFTDPSGNDLAVWTKS